MVNRKSALTFRFKNWSYPLREDELIFKKLLELASNREFVFIDSPSGVVDVEIESVYPGSIVPDPKVRLNRFIQSKFLGGIKFDGGKNTPNQQPTGSGRVKIFFTGENVRPPEGAWDAYLSFDLHSFGGRNAYFPLWWITCSDVVLPRVSHHLGKALTVEEMLKPRMSDFEKRSKFCIAYIGKAYPFRMHAITALGKIGKVDVFGSIARKEVENKFDLAQDYRFAFSFENDIYPGYVTEKPIEAWASGAVPLYWGSDPEGYLNEKALINLSNFKTLEKFIEKVREVNESKTIWESYATQPILSKSPNLKQVLQVLGSAIGKL